MNINCPKCNKNMIYGKLNNFIECKCLQCMIYTYYENSYLSFYALYTCDYRISNKGFIEKRSYPKELFDFNLEVCSAKQAYEFLNKYLENKIFE